MSEFDRCQQLASANRVPALLASELMLHPGGVPREGAARGCRTDPVGRSDLNDQLDGVRHEKPPVPSHHQGGSLALGGLHDGQDALNEVLGIVLVLLEHRHPLPQPARPGLLVRVRLRLDRRYFHHG